VTTAEEERTETQPRREPQRIYCYRPDFCLDICKLPLSSGPKGPAIMTRTAYRLDVRKCTFVVAPIYNRGSLTPCAQFPRASRSPSQGKLWHVRSFLALRADFRCSEAPMSREAVHASYRSYYSQHSTVLPHYFGSARSDAGLDGTQDSDRPISQGRRRIVAVSQPEHPRDLV